MSTPSLLFFAGLAVAMVYCYLGIRRQWGPPWRISAVGTALCAVAMSLVLATNTNADPLLAIVYGVPLGAVLAIVTIIAALYFTRQSARPLASDEEQDG
jgi:O-antigen/teichoic acid export membrane protein